MAYTVITEQQQKTGSGEQKAGAETSSKIRGDYYITSYKGRILSALCQNDKLIQASFCAREQQSLATGTILIGKVLNKLENIQAVFVELAPGKRGFLPYDEITGNIPKQGEQILVQIIKDAVKTKDPVLSTDLSISGKYVVIHYKNRQFHISKKATPKQAKRLKEALQDTYKDYPYGIILRTNATLLHDIEPLLRELELLRQKLEHIIQYADSRTTYSVLYQPLNAYIEKLRDTYGLDYQRVITDDPVIYQSLSDYLHVYAPEEVSKLLLFENKSMSLLNFYKLGEKIENALCKNVWLKCGGYLVIEPTESLTAIDVNTGKYTEKKDREQAVFNVNIEAAKEVARQLRLRNLSGMILVDFINMKDAEHNQALLDLLRDYVAFDPVQTNVIDMTPLGLVEITRKKINKTLREQYNETDTNE
ncbi:MAG: ribonuclease E/G [Lachnospiraceae bacterium]